MELLYFYDKVERKYDNADFSLKYWQHGTVQKHRHVDYYEIVIPNGNPLLNFVDNQKRLMPVGDIAIISPGPSHYIHSVNTSGIFLYNIAIRKEYFENFIRGKKQICDMLKQNPVIYTSVDSYTYSVLLQYIAQIDNRKYNEKFLTLVESILHIIISSLYIQSASDPEANKIISSFCNDAIWKIDNYSYIAYNITDIYSMYPVSHTTFNTEFKKITGKTPIDYLTDKKMEYAKNITLTTDLSILEIANVLGYDSVSSFIRKFKSVYGTTPLQYRKKHADSKKLLMEIYNDDKS